MVKTFLENFSSWVDSTYERVYEKEYTIHAVSLGVKTSSRSMLEELDEQFHYFASEGDAPKPDFTISLFHVPHLASAPAKIPENARQVSVSEIMAGFTISIFQDVNGVIYVDVSGKALVMVDIDNFCAIGFVEENVRQAPPLLVSSYVVLPALGALLRKKSLYMIHGGCLAHEGEGMIIVGPSGSGKTTLTARLLGDERFSYLSDDSCLLDDSGDEIKILSFPTLLHARYDSVKRFPKIYPANGFSREKGREKISFYVEDIAKASFSESCKPRLLIFPKVGGGAKHKATKLSPAKTLQILLPESLSIMDTRTPRDHLDALGKLVEKTEAYEIIVGKDLENIPDFFAEMFTNYDRAQTGAE